MKAKFGKEVTLRFSIQRRSLSKNNFASARFSPIHQVKVVVFGLLSDISSCLILILSLIQYSHRLAICCTLLLRGHLSQLKDELYGFQV